MSRHNYTDEELARYFNNPEARRRSHRAAAKGIRGYFHRRFDRPKKAEAAFLLSSLLALLFLFTGGAGLYTYFITDDLPTFEQLDNPELQLATIAYTADGKELARYAFQNRSWVTYDQISPHVINALVATEDHRFYNHWGIDLFRTVVSIVKTFLGDQQGGSTITQQLARNLYNAEIGLAFSIPRKIKEMITAVQLERRYTKREIIEMYLNTVEFGNNAFGIEAAAQTIFSKPAATLDPLESATLIGRLQAITFYNPIRNPENSKRRRNVVLSQMVKYSYLGRDYYDEHKEELTETNFNPSAELTSSLAPYFAEYVRNWMRTWASENNYNMYTDGLVVYTTLDSRLQELAKRAVDEKMEGLQAVVDVEWSRSSYGVFSTDIDDYLEHRDYEPFSYFWNTQTYVVNSFIRESERYRLLRNTGTGADEALLLLRQDEAYMDSLKAVKTRLEAGMVSIDPNTGYVKTWVGGRDFAVDKYDKVGLARRQPGSTFKPFVYTTAIDNGYPPSYSLPDSSYTYVDPWTGVVWQPGNSGNDMTGQMMTLREALARSKNTITARVITQLVNPSQVAFYAKRMGINSELDEVPAMGLGTSDVTLLEITSAYGTLASGGLQYNPIVITQIEDRFGNILYRTHPAPREAISEATAYTIVDMMRGTIQHPQGTGQRIRVEYRLGDYDLAAKTGTTQNSADCWFMLMHPQLVTGAWVGFNDRRVTFRTDWWGQGAHSALHLVGDFFRSVADSVDIGLDKDAQFPHPEDFGLFFDNPVPGERDQDTRRDDGRVNW